MRTVLVTGGAGFIGSHLAADLVAHAAAVRVFDNFATGKRENLTEIHNNLEIITGDLRDEATVRRAVAGAEVVFHHAAEISVPRSIADPRGTYEVNVAGTLNVLLAARDAGCRRVVFASSSAVYGDAPAQPKHEAMLPAPLSPYASSKLAGEELCTVFARAYEVETVALRYFSVFGPRQDPRSPYAAVIPRFVDALLRGEPPTMYGDGEQTRDFIYVANVVEANLRAAEDPAVAGGVFNVASGSEVSLNEVLATLSHLLGVSIAPVHEPDRAGDIRHSVADISAARDRLGYEVAVPFDAGLALTVAAMTATGQNQSST
jgi:UDP-glucose 4-epimerase